MLRWSTACVLCAALVAPRTAAQASPNLRWSVEPGALVARLADGRLALRLDLERPDRPSLRASPGGRLLTDSGRLVDPSSGHLLAHLRTAGTVGPPRATATGPCTQWSTPALLLPDGGREISDTFTEPLVDASGNAWIVNAHVESGASSLRVLRSVGHSGAWLPIETVSDSTAFVASPVGAIDGDGVVTIVFRDIDDGYHIYAVRSLPGGGWGPLVEVLDTPVFFQSLAVAADADGNVVVVYDPLQLGTTTLWTTRRDADTGTWSRTQPLSPAGSNAVLPRLVRGPDGEVLWLVYRINAGPGVGIHAARWDARLRAFLAPVLLPGSASVAPGPVGTTSIVPSVVGADGEATVFWQALEDELFVLRAQRTTGGRWGAAVDLLPPSPWPSDLYNFAHISANEGGDVLALAGRYEGPGAQHTYAFRHLVGSGWQPADTLLTTNAGFSTRVRGGWLAGRRAVATALGDEATITSVLFNGAAWSTAPLDVPGGDLVFRQEVLAHRDELLLVHESDVTGDVRATWLPGSSAFVPAGDGVPGTAGLPTLSAGCELLPSGTTTLQLQGARPHSVALLVLGLTTIDTPFKGGVLVPSPDALVALPTGSRGALAIEAIWPATLPSDFALWMQAWIVDPQGPAGFAATGALSGAVLGAPAEE